MTLAKNEPATWNLMPEAWRREVAMQLQDGEKLLAWLLPDLDAQLHFADGCLVLTDQRLLAADRLPNRSDSEQSKSEVATCWKSWTRDGQLRLQSLPDGPLGVLQLIGPDKLLASWRFTAGQKERAARFSQRLNNEIDFPQFAPDHDATARSVCMACGTVLESGHSNCDGCSPMLVTAPGRSLWRLARFAKPRSKVILLGFMLTLASTAASLIPPYLTMPLLDDILIPLQNGQSQDAGHLHWYLSGLLGAAIAAWLLGWARSYVLACTGERISADLRNETYRHLQHLSLEFFGGKRTGDLISRVSDDTDRVCDFLSGDLIEFATDALMIVLTAAVLFTISPTLAIVMLAPLPLLIWLVQRIRGWLRHGYARSHAAWSEIVNVLADTIPGIRVVKAFAQEQREIERFRLRNDHVVAANNHVNRLGAAFGPALKLLADCGLLVIWVCGAWLVTRTQITIGELTAFVAYIGRMYTRLDSMSRLLASTQQAASSTHRIFEILDRVPTVAEPATPVDPGRVAGQIEFRDVSFKYGSREVLHDINLSIAPGEMIGLVGASGAGKSTLTNLVCRFYDAAAGAILVDGVDIRSFPIHEFRRNIGIVLQEPYLFYGSIAENIAYGRPDATPSEILAAARAARAHPFILKLPDGYDSLVGERGESLSGGERQRISIARALLTDPRILILDEATSAVDTETEREIQEALDNLIRGRTTIAVAHRMSTLRRADRLVVLEGGRISEVGPHDDLLDRRGVYARLHRAQLELAGAAAVAAE